MLLDGYISWLNFDVYSKYLITRNIKEQSKVIPIYILYLGKSFSFREAQAITIETLDEIRTRVLTVARGTLSSAAYRSKSPGGAASLRKIYAENRPPNSMISEAKNIQIPNLELINPVSSRSFMI